MHHHLDRERAGEIAPQVGAAVAFHEPDQPVDLPSHDGREPLVHRLEAKRPREGIAMAPVLLPVEREHARADDLSGREAWIVDREHDRVSHHLQGEVAAGHDPGLQRGDPRDRLVLPEPRERRVRVVLELLERDRGADRECDGHAADDSEWMSGSEPNRSSLSGRKFDKGDA